MSGWRACCIRSEIRRRMAESSSTDDGVGIDSFLMLSACTIHPLQLIQNAAARLVFNLPRDSHVTPLFKHLHWLPVAARIKFKNLTLAYSAANRMARTSSSHTRQPDHSDLQRQDVWHFLHSELWFPVYPVYIVSPR
ncbi:hypothetical protein JZ751_021265 [Albula glossodonta]|uniref:Uncharacterized protein n=1 Tax=Albula glossodonta TaxID=121402 RepID=A0A8T2NNN5_9TELE|nr:hypothetical protein JZ751_021265 [Albula glossodonta]